jgi:uncharacterized protein (TIGR03435 family)
VVVDRTGLEGKYDWELQWVPDDLTPNSVSPPEGPLLFVAIREQAGFRLERQRRFVEVLVVESVERPTPD